MAPEPPPPVTVIIPAYNVAQWIGRAIESVLEQTRPAFEIIVVDDGSQDDTCDIVDKYINEYPDTICLIQGRHQGANAARNKGLGVATGKYVQFLDADDWLHPRKFELQLELLESDANIDVAFADRWDCREEAGEIEFVRIDADFPEAREALVRELLATLTCPDTNSLLLSAALLRKSNIGWDENLKACQEWDLQLQLLVRGATFRRCPQALSYYRKSRSGSIWAHDRKKVLQAVEHAYYKWEDFYQERDPRWRPVLAAGLFSIAREYERIGYIKEAFRILEKVHKYDPEFEPDEDSEIFNRIAATAGTEAALYAAWAKQRVRECLLEWLSSFAKRH